MIPALFLGILGAGYLVVGVGTAITAGYFVFSSYTEPETMGRVLRNSSYRNFIAFSPIISTVCGLAWLIAAMGFWRRQWMKAMLAFVIGLVCYWSLDLLKVTSAN